MSKQLEKEAAKLDELLEGLKTAAHEKLRKALSSGAIPDEWMQSEDNFSLQKAVLDSLCRDRPYSPHRKYPGLSEDFDNLHLFL